ncbi:hypothetical protein [Rouxiella badensis]|uniref:hypothetical protein n=1 Tax=Rouxiella badensis TaxID=1646377 RepID=UPI0022AAC491|nr:hypothetical protein [Rouxiella badensis]WAT08863.1 hypothetical protein O1V65_22010 [Rouxiella badensis]
MKKNSLLFVLFFFSISSMGAVTEGKVEKPFTVNNEVICLKEIQRKITPFIIQYEEENGAKYKYIVKSGLSYKDSVGLRLQINRVDSGQNVRVADLDYYWRQERGSMCEPVYMVLDRSQ